MASKNHTDEEIDKRMDQFNASAKLDGMDLSQDRLDELKNELKSGKSVEDLISEIKEKYKE